MKLTGECIPGGLLAGIGTLRHRAPRRMTIDTRVGLRDPVAELMGLEDRGWLVSRAVPTDWRGTIDVLVTSPSVSFVVDFAAPRQEGPSSARLDRHVSWARETYGPTRRIVPVLCIRGSTRHERLASGVHRLGVTDTLNFLLDWG